MHFTKYKNIKLFLFLLPALLFNTIYVAYPMVDTLVLSFCRGNGITKISYVGLTNWINVFKNKDFAVAMSNTFLIGVVVIFIMLPLAIGMAIQLNKGLRGSDLMKTIFFAPIAFSSVMIGMVWYFILEPQHGFLNALFKLIGLQNFVLNWFRGEWLTALVYGFICLWQWMGFYMLIITAGLKAIPNEIYESAEIDGASGFKATRHITLPLIGEQVNICLLIGISSVLKVYELIVAITDSTPGYSSANLASFMMIKLFRERQVGFGCVLSTISTILCLFFSIVLTIRNNRKSYQF